MVDSDPVTPSQDEVIEHRLTVHHMEPGATPRLEFVNEVMPGLENAGAHQRVLVNSQGSLASVRGRHNA